MPKVIFSEYVEPELTAIWEFIALDNINAADRFLESCDSTFQDLARMPNMGFSRKFEQERLRELRSFRVKDFENYLIFYRPLPDGISVFHILHGARDIQQFFKNE
jgi:toxin ParE1/3/4